MDNVTRQRDVCAAASVLLSDVVGREVEIGLAYGDRTNGAGFQIPGIVLVENSLCTPDIVRGNLSGPVDFWMVVDGQKNMPARLSGTRKTKTSTNFKRNRMNWL